MSRVLSSGWLRVGCGLLLIGWLLWQAAGHDTLAQLRATPPSPVRLLLAWSVLAAAVSLSFVRWCGVVRAAGIDVSLGEAMRLGAIGFACNFVALGSIGGDVVKATLLAKPRAGKRAAAVSTILVDRLMGLLGFLLYASAAILWTGAAAGDDPTPLRVLCRTVLALAGVATLCFGVVMSPGGLLERLAALLHGVPLVGGLAERAGDLAATYHDGRGWLWRALVAGLAMNGVYILSFYLAATSLPLPIPTLAENYLAVPLVAITGTLPISPNGLGTIEAAAEYLYRTLEPDAPVGTGALAALVHRLAMVATGVACAVGYYAAGGRRVDEAMADEATSAINSADGSGVAVESA